MMETIRKTVEKHIGTFFSNFFSERDKQFGREGNDELRIWIAM